ncbi:uncharacterized protein PHALS_06813 [Plasmopara halstedii]|uniref:Uncharacterized protein n=1 Tax=Plasmopara halstedii TaxID=4781 RepID=A0A0P1B5Q6_PLAHL|nr:uncharacterized protein PHALS_06813 [Plasmopara halstedii]CEG49023.1 hypothetical protein PHALS_06813 [Plasmopara halstedii]|eukprot:XP_024585392.1 hypothetical protein PHALS_06813 [Plasmopara halstedii]
MDGTPETIALLTQLLVARTALILSERLPLVSASQRSTSVILYPYLRSDMLRPHRKLL